MATRQAKPIKHRGKWRARWIDASGGRGSSVHNTYGEALRALAVHRVEVDDVRRGLRDAPPPEKSFSEACDYWLANRAPRKRSAKDDESIIRRHLRPAFGALRLRDIGTAHIDAFTNARAALDLKTVANLLTLFKSILKVAHDLGWLARVPKVEKPRVRLNRFDFRFLRTDDEIAKFLRAAKAEADDVHALYSMAVYTGMRAGEIAGLRWDDIDWDRRLITVQRSFDGPTKADDVRYVPILDALITTLRAWRLRSPLSVVFPSQAGTMLGPSARMFQEVFHRVLLAAGFPTRTTKAGNVRGHIKFHDLRHTFASHWVMRGGDMFKLQKILGHKTVQMTMRYAHLVPDAFAEDFARFRVVTDESASVVPLRAAGVA